MLSLSQCVLLLCGIAVVVNSAPSHGGGMERSAPKHPPFLSRNVTAQLQPEGYDNTNHTVPNFFAHQLIYVEDSKLLLWHPLTGEWKLFQIQRDCTADCPIIPETPESSGIWIERRFHTFVFMGCHSSTGYGHMLDIEPSSGEYWIWLFDAKAANPFKEIVAHHRRVEMNQNRVAYLGKDEILFFDAKNQHYKIYLVQPRLPMYHDEDPIGPFDALVEGSFNLHDDVVYTGSNRLIDYSHGTGRLTLLEYDRTAVDSQPPFVQHVHSETLKFESSLVLTYVGESQVIALNPYTAAFKAFNLTGITDEPVSHFYGFGSLLKGDHCLGESNCGKCLSKSGCGWCGSTSSCLRGNAISGPCFTNCTTWEVTMCPGEPCHTHRSCTLCLSDPFCGWCADTETCTEGSHSGPLFGSCDYSKLLCPNHYKEDDVDISNCVGQIE